MENRDRQVITEFVDGVDDDGWWIIVLVDGLVYADLGPFETPEVRDRVRDDMTDLLLQSGGVDMPDHLQ